MDVNGSANLTDKLITFKISYRTLFNGWQTNGLSRVQACFSAPYTFAPRAGFERVTSQYDGDGDGVAEPWYTGGPARVQGARQDERRRRASRIASSCATASPSR